MTGHELDLDEIRRLTRGAEGGLLVTNTIPALCDEVKALRAKLAAAEQERDQAFAERADLWRLNGQMAAALAAVRRLHYGIPLAMGQQWKCAHCRQSWPCATTTTLSLTAAEQDEPKRFEIPEPDGQSRDWSDALEMALEESQPKREQS